MPPSQKKKYWLRKLRRIFSKKKSKSWGSTRKKRQSSAKNASWERKKNPTPGEFLVGNNEEDTESKV